MTLKAIIFDLDGTLIDQDGAERAALTKLYAKDVKLDPLPPFSQFLRVWRNTAEEYLERFLKNELSFDEQRILRGQAIFKHFNADLSREGALDLFNAYIVFYREAWRAYDETLPVLAELKKRYRLGIITNGQPEQQRSKVEQCGLSPFFEHVLVSGEIQIAKPAPGIFDASRKAFGLEASEMIYVGDRLNIDVDGALGAAWQACWLDRVGMPNPQNLLPYLHVSSLTELDQKI